MIKIKRSVFMPRFRLNRIRRHVHVQFVIFPFLRSVPIFMYGYYTLIYYESLYFGYMVSHPRGAMISC